ncbi:hypothetical protein CXB51_006224 [Gossypium anomalum]|uniref:Pectinesterase n=1 Tax=Gossypium anomalum TaxID=47600 RepID=A0A8J5ZEM3_9ROSI|nr:hypothetical protein CXB51_006224 [Gossypium anomalum]
MGKLPAIIGICSVLVVAMVAAIAVGVSRAKDSDNDDAKVSTSEKAVQSICQTTDYRETCENSLSNANTTDPKELIKVGFQAAIQEIGKVISNSSTIQNAAKDPMTRQAVDNCKELMGYAIDDLKASFNQLGAFDVSKLDEYVENLKIWMGGAITYQQTCLDGFMNVSSETGVKMKALLNTSQQLTSNGLAMVTDITKIIKDLNIPGMEGVSTGSKRKLMAEDGFPSWVSFKQRQLLQQNAADMKPNVVVAKDGSGKFNSINEALKEVPMKNTAPFVIHIKAGVYNEQVLVAKTMTNVVFVGDGPTKTVITGRMNFVDGTVTFKTATLGTYHIYMSLIYIV